MRSYWVEGVRQFVQAVDAGRPIDTVVYSPVLLKNDLAEMLARKLTARGVARCEVTPEQFRTVSVAARASGIGAIVRQHWTPIEDVWPTDGLGWLVVESIRSPGNFGTILRTAEATGVAGVICLGPAADPFDPATVRASMGGVFHLRLVRTTHDRFRRWAIANGVAVVGLAPSASRLWTDLPTDRPVALLLGDERAGLSPAAHSLCDAEVRLPMTGRADSLNVGIAAGVVMYELVRRSLPSAQSAEAEA